jgi:hypothetical protein
MLDLPSQAILDKNRLVGGCVRLPLTIDAARVQNEVAALPASVWGTPAGRVGVHSAADAVFLRGYAPAEGEKPIEDRPVLAHLPYIRSILEELIPARPLRALLARLPAGATIAPHVDRLPYFSKSLRIHIAVETNDEVSMLCAGRAYHMRTSEVWALNNSAMHGVINAHPSLPRTHLICDFLPSPELLSLIEAGDRDLGRPMEQLAAHPANVAAR